MLPKGLFFMNRTKGQLIPHPSFPLRFFNHCCFIHTHAVPYITNSCIHFGQNRFFLLGTYLYLWQPLLLGVKKCKSFAINKYLVYAVCIFLSVLCADLNFVSSSAVYFRRKSLMRLEYQQWLILQKESIRQYLSMDRCNTVPSYMKIEKKSDSSPPPQFKI